MPPFDKLRDHGWRDRLRLFFLLRRSGKCGKSVFPRGARPGSTRSATQRTSGRSRNACPTEPADREAGSLVGSRSGRFSLNESPCQPLPHQTVREVLPHTAFRQHSSPVFTEPDRKSPFGRKVRFHCFSASLRSVLARLLHVIPSCGGKTATDACARNHREPEIAVYHYQRRSSYASRRLPR